jgi:hypothetical protein
MQFIETAAFGSRVAGKLVNRLSLGITLQHSMFTVSRLFLPPLLLSLSFLIESNLNVELFLLIAAILTFSAFLTSLLVFIKFNYFQLLFQHLFVRYEYNTIPIAILRVIFSRRYEFNKVDLINIPKIRSLQLKKIFASIFAYFFLSTGFLTAFSFAILIPEYRMTVSQLATVFHGIGAIVLALYIDPMISKSIDIEFDNSNWVKNIYSIFVGRLVAYLLASSMFLSFYLYIINSV